MREQIGEQITSGTREGTRCHNRVPAPQKQERLHAKTERLGKYADEGLRRVEKFRKQEECSTQTVL